MYPSKSEDLVLATDRGDLLSFNMQTKHLEEIDKVADLGDEVNRQFEELMNEARSFDSNIEDKSTQIERVFVDSNNNILFSKQGSLHVYRPTGDCEIVIDRLPESTAILYFSRR